VHRSEKIGKKSLKRPILKVQSRFWSSVSFKVINVDTSWKPISSFCYGKPHQVYVCVYPQPFSR